MAFFEPVLEALNSADVRYVVVGGTAVVLHGYARLTMDLDLVVDLTPGAVSKAIDALVGIGLRPSVPVDPSDFADAEVRRSWIEEKGMMVLTLYDPGDPLRRVDVFVEDVVPFEDLWGRSELVELATTTVRVAGIPDLITMKRLAGRPRDLEDIRALEAIASKRERESPDG